MDQPYDDWLEVQQKIKRERNVWGQLGKILRIERADIMVSEMFYREVVQAVIILGSESWVN